MVAAGDAAAAAEEARLGLWLSGRQPRQPTAQERWRQRTKGRRQGNVDYVGFRIQCPNTTVFGVARAQRMGSFLSWPEQRQRLFGKLGEARCDELDIEAEEGKWRLNLEIPADERWWLLRDIRRRYHDICVQAAARPRGPQRLQEAALD